MSKQLFLFAKNIGLSVTYIRRARFQSNARSRRLQFMSREQQNKQNMAVSMETADYVLGYLNAYQISAVVGAACKLELFDVIHSAGPITVEQLVTNQKWEYGATKRLLDVLCAMNFLKKTGTDSDATYENTDHAAYLRRHANVTVWGAHSMFDCLRPSFESIPDMIRGTKKTGGDEASHGEEGGDGGEGEEMSEDDWKSMSGLLDPYLPHIVCKHDLSAYRVAYDLGGGIGNLARVLCRKYPDMEVTVFEREDVVKVAKELHPKLLSAGENLKVKFDSVDFFKEELPEADLFLACQVARHFTQQEWNDFISKTFAKLNPGGGLMILESILNDNRAGPSHINTLEMSFAAYGSSFITISECKLMFEKHGFVDVKFDRVGNRCDVSVMFGRKPK